MAAAGEKIEYGYCFVIIVVEHFSLVLFRFYYSFQCVTSSSSFISLLS